MTTHFFGLILLGTIIVLTLIVLYVIYGRNEDDKKRYDCAHATIFFLMDYGMVNNAGYKFIRSKFMEMSHFKCDREKLQVKEMEFLKKFYEFVPDVCVTSFNGVIEKRNINGKE